VKSDRQEIPLIALPGDTEIEEAAEILRKAGAGKK
jgi:hypothetical protein